MQRHLPEVHEFLRETGKWDLSDDYGEEEEEGVMTGIGMLSSPPIGAGFGHGMRGGSRPAAAYMEVSRPETPPDQRN